MEPTRFYSFASFLVISCLAVTTQGYDFGCSGEWDGPSPDNDPIECILDWPMRDLGMLTPPILPLFLTILLLVFFPISFCCRCLGACGSNNPRPGADCCCEGEEWDSLAEHEALLTYPERHVSCLKVTIAVILVSTAACIVTISYGITLFISGLDFFLDSSKADVLDWALRMLRTVDSQVRTSDGGYIQPITNETFVPITDLLDWATDLHTEAKGYYADYIDGFKIGVFVASCVPTLATFIVGLMALCNVRSVLPRLCQCFFFLISIIGGILGTLLLLLGIATTCGCGEITLQQWQSPGIFQWYIVQQCESQSVFGNTTAQLRSMEVDNSVNACREILELCDANPNFNLSTPHKIYVCTLTEDTLHARCGSFADMSELVVSLPFKNGTAALCPTCTTFSDCATKCVDSGARDTTSETLTLIKFAANATAMIDRYLPELNCDSLITRFIQPLGQCSDMSLGLLLVGGGAAYGTLVLMWCIILLCIGQKLFFNRAAVQEAEQKAYDDACKQAAVAGDASTYNKLMRSKSVAALKYSGGDELAVMGIMGVGAAGAGATRFASSPNSSFSMGQARVPTGPVPRPSHQPAPSRQYDEDDDYYDREPVIKNSSFLNSSFVKHTHNSFNGNGSALSSRGVAGLSDERIPTAPSNRWATISADYDDIAVTDLDS